MAPFLALILCMLLVLWLLKLDHKQSEQVTAATWIPTLWFLICASRPLAWWITGQNVTGDISALEGSSLDRNVLLLLILIACLLLVRSSFEWTRFISENKPLLLLFGFMLFTIAWSDFPFVSFKRWFKTAGSVIMGIVVLSEPNPPRALMCILRRTSYILIPFSIVLIKYFPDLGVQFGRWSGHTMWAGVTMGKNGLGPLCVMAMFYLLWSVNHQIKHHELFKDRSVAIAECIILTITLILMRGPGGAYSVTSIIILVLGVSIFFILRTPQADSARMGTRIIMAVCGLGLAVGLVTLIFEEAPLKLIATLFGRDATLTGRTDLIWSKLLPIAMQHPLMGIGYGAFWIRPVDFDFTMPINQAHNGYLDVMIELGGIGLVLLFCCIASFFNKARLNFEIDPDWASLRMAFLVMVLVHNFTETSFLRSTILMWNVFILFGLVGPIFTQKTYVILRFKNAVISETAQDSDQFPAHFTSRIRTKNIHC